MIHVHYAAVHETAAAFYQFEILEAWSRTPDDARYQLNASINAEQFYQRNGYKALLHGTLRLSSECEMECIKMERYL